MDKVHVTTKIPKTMKRRTHSKNHPLLRPCIFYCSLAALFFLTACAPVAVHPFDFLYRRSDPIVGWKSVYLQKEISPAIQEDYQDFIKNHIRGFTSIDYLEDGTGKHAIAITEGKDGTYHRYVLIYDQNDKRIKTIKYMTGHYAC